MDLAASQVNPSKVNGSMELVVAGCSCAIALLFLQRVVLCCIVQFNLAEIAHYNEQTPSSTSFPS